jgi:elongation factor P
VPIGINQLVRGMALKFGDDIFIVTAYSHVKPGKGSAFARVTLKNVRTPQTLERTFKTAEKLEDVPLEECKMQCLYHTDGDVHFMDLTSFEEAVVPKNVIGDEIKFLQEQQEVIGLRYHDEILRIQLPTFIIAEITHTEPGFKGDSSRSGNKPATIDTGATVQVPLFIDIGDKVKIDTRTGEYVERTKQ